MSRLPALRPQRVVRALERTGFVLMRVRGSHHRLHHPDKPDLLVTVPMPNKDLKPGTLHAIIRQAGMTVEEFAALL